MTDPWDDLVQAISSALSSNDARLLSTKGIDIILPDGTKREGLDIRFSTRLSSSIGEVRRDLRKVASKGGKDAEVSLMTSRGSSRVVLRVIIY